MASVYVYNPGDMLPQPVIQDLYPTGYPWLPYDVDNLYPQRLVAFTQDSPTHKAIISKKLQFAVGKGLTGTKTLEIPVGGSKADGTVDDGGKTYKLEIPTDTQQFLNQCSLDGSIQETFKRCLNDIIVFNGFCLELLYNEANTHILQVKHMPFQDVRVAFPAVVGNIDGFYTSHDWLNRYTARSMPTEAGLAKISRFAGRSNSEKQSLLYEYEYDSTLRYYPKPTYASALNFISTEGEISRYFLNSAKNNFTPPFSITFPFNLSKEEQEKNAALLQAFQTGGGNAGKAMILHGQSDTMGGMVAPIINQLGKNDRTNEFNEVFEICVQQIMIAHNITSPTILGLSGSATIGGNANEIKISNQLFQNVVIEPIQQMFLNGFKKILNFNGLNPNELKIIPLDVLAGFKENV